MKLSAPIKNNIITVICYLYVLLFVYTAVSKFLDFENFQVQLGQSPLLSAFAGWVSWGVLLIELFTAGLLMIEKTRRIGLYIAFALMTMFTAYIFIILNFSPFVPCSCGGVLEKMGWTEHLIFNISFLLLATLGIFLSVEKKEETKNTKKKTAIILSTSLVLSIGFIALLFVLSEDIIHKRNNFVRRFPPFPAKRVNNKDLKFNSYYFAGKDHNKIYLGNHSAPALITELDTTLQIAQTYHIRITDTLFEFRNIRLKVIPPNFYLFDGTVPCIFKGNLKDVRAYLQHTKIPGFTKLEVVDSTTFIIRTLNKSRENLLSILNIETGQVKNSEPQLLQKQIDGLFDTDGILQYSQQQQKFVYLYYYRNQYTVTDKNLNLLSRGNTIDTTTRAKIKVQYVESKKQKKFSKPPFLVNRLSAVHNNLLFVNSMLPGKYDDMKMWKNANVMDVYDITTNSYLMSFYIYKVDGEKIDDLIVTDTHLFVLAGNNIVSYKLSKELKEKFHIKNIPASIRNQTENL